MHLYKSEAALRAAAAQDPIYQQLLADCQAAEPDYLQLRGRLSKADLQILDSYISLCEELDHRTLCLALEQEL